MRHTLASHRERPLAFSPTTRTFVPSVGWPPHSMALFKFLPRFFFLYFLYFFLNDGILRSLDFPGSRPKKCQRHLGEPVSRSGEDGPVTPASPTLGPTGASGAWGSGDREVRPGKAGLGSLGGGKPGGVSAGRPLGARSPSTRPRPLLPRSGPAAQLNPEAAKRGLEASRRARNKQNKKQTNPWGWGERRPPPAFRAPLLRLTPPEPL